MKSQVASNLFISLALLNTRMLKRMDNTLSAHGISFTEYLILGVLNNALKETMPRIELARSVGLSASGVTRLLAPMEKLGLVHKEKNPRDARQSLVKLSGAGKTIFEESSVTFADGAMSILGALTESQMTKMETMSARLS